MSEAFIVLHVAALGMRELLSFEKEKRYCKNEMDG